MSFYRQTVELNARNSSAATDVPIQVVYPIGLTGIALPVSHANSQGGRNNRRINTFHPFVAAAAASSNSTGDRMNILRMTVAFIALLVVNVVITITLYSNADTNNLSKVEDEKKSSDLPRDFTQTDFDDHGVTLLVFTLLNLCLAGYGAVFRSTTALFFFEMITMSIIVLGMTSAPGFLYTLRYLLDAMLLPMSCNLRTQIGPNVVPIPRTTVT